MINLIDLANVLRSKNAGATCTPCGSARAGQGRAGGVGRRVAQLENSPCASARKRCRQQGDSNVRDLPIHPVVTWDTPDDTAGIHLGFHLPLPLTNSALCGMLAAHRSALSIKIGCADCTEIFIP